MSAADPSSSWVVALRVIVLQKLWLMKLLVHMMRVCLVDEQFMSRLMLQHKCALLSISRAPAPPIRSKIYA